MTDEFGVSPTATANRVVHAPMMVEGQRYAACSGRPVDLRTVIPGGYTACRRCIERMESLGMDDLAERFKEHNRSMVRR